MSYPVDRRGFLRVSGAAAATAALGLTSCSSDSSGPVTLSWWDYFTLDNFQPGMNRLIKDIEDGVPDVRIKRRSFPFAELERQLTLGAISGDLPDLAIVDNVSMNTLGGSRSWPTSPPESRSGARPTTTTRARGKAARSAERPWASPTTATASPSTATPACSRPPASNPPPPGTNSPPPPRS